MKVKDIALDGVVRQNPVFKLVLGTCPALAVTVSMSNALGMGLAVVFVLLCSNVLISMLRNVIPDKVRIPAFIMIIATFVTVVMLVLDKYMPDLYDSLGLFLPLIVVNCLILARAEAFASSNSVWHSALDGIFMGLGFTVGLLAMGLVREFLGSGSIFGLQIMDFSIDIFATSAGGFLTFGLLIALFVAINNKISEKNKHKKHQKIAAVEQEVKDAVAAHENSQAEVK